MKASLPLFDNNLSNKNLEDKNKYDALRFCFNFYKNNNRINESTLKTDSIAKIRLDHCIKTITYVSDGIGKPKSFKFFEFKHLITRSSKLAVKYALLFAKEHAGGQYG